MTSSTTDTTAGSRRRRIRIVAGVALVVLLLAGCAASANDAASPANDAGFWLGLWQGFIAPFAFIVSLFDDSVGIYEVENNGGWYDFGYIIGLSAIFSGSGAGSRGRRR
ncbi:MAG: hypothetical protein WCA30_00160 [Dermatophilaceae bacterium]